MNNAQTLLFDVLKLRSQYEDHEFHIVLEVLRNKNQHPELVSVLEMALEVSVLSGKKPARSLGQKETALHIEEILEVAQSEPENHALLVQIHELVSSSKVFRTKEEFRQFIIRRVTHVKKADTRPSMVQQYLISLTKLSFEDLKFELEILRNPKTKQGESFLRMANRIVDPHN